MISDPDSSPVPVMARRVLIAVFSVAVVMVAIALGASWIDSRDRHIGETAMFERLPSSREDEFVSSNRCRSCHPSEHASWHRTYHRTMTQPALAESVVGDFDGSSIMSDGLAYRVFMKGEEFWAEMPDPEEMMYVVQGGKPTPLEEIPRVERQVVMTTGSHHYQTYWVTGAEKYGNLLQTLPLIYLIKEQRWVPREAAFMKAPEDRARMISQWNNHCINCHSTGGNPGLLTKTKEGSFATAVGELGISCEACHGPGEEHIKANRNPLRRYALHGKAGEEDRTIVNPANLDHERSSQVCGQCHGVYIRTDGYGMKYATEGIQFRPGEDINTKRYYIAHPTENSTPQQWEEYHKNPKFFAERWWEDGTVLAGGREYSGISASGCYIRGEMSCLSCHSMHDSDPVDQLNGIGRSQQACVQCHNEPAYTTNLSSHTHHAPHSSGSQCMNCHMPHTTYALFGAIRNHQIQSPNIASSANYGVPNACNLCHLDKTLEWTSRAMTANYETAPVDLTAEQKEVSAALLWMLKGHAAQRVIAAWHTGWKPAQEASGADWLAPFQARLLADPYGVVRYVAAENLKTLDGFSRFEFDFIAPEDELRRKATEAIVTWNNGGSPARKGSEILIDSDGSVMEERVKLLLEQRDNRPVDIKE